MKAVEEGAVFLLDQQYPNLFEPAGTNELDYRCKGCGAGVRRWKREQHFRQHQRQQVRLDEARRAQVKRDAAARLAKARRAKRSTKAGA